MSTPEILPDPKKCRTSLVDDDLYLCTTRTGYTCRYVISFYHEYYCDHRDRKLFRQETRQKAGDV